MAEGRAVQVVVLDKNTYKLDEQELKSILLRDDIKDLPVVLVSVVGAYRTGKSFLLNFFLRYLKSTQEARDDGSWLGSADEPLLGFSWRGGSRRNTTGLLLWSEPFIFTAPSGEKTALLLMDTQGTFDNMSTVRDCSIIFAMSALVSSVVIYNISQNIREDDLQNLQLFTEYGKLSKTDGKMFQVLEFLIRDWAFEYEYAYGEEGGKKFLEDKLKIDPSQPKELQELRQNISSSFEKLSCFLMPHPGLKIVDPKYNGKIGELEPQFRDYLKQLASSLFTPANFVVKRIHGEPVTAWELCTYFQTYLNIFNSSETPSPSTILNATSEAGLLLCAESARHVYEASMRSARHTCRDNVRARHVHALGLARTAFNDKKKIASASAVEETLTKLVKELDNRLSHYELMNSGANYTALEQARVAYETHIAQVTGGNSQFCIHNDALQTVYDAASKAAIETFDANRDKCDNDEERTTLLETLNNKYATLRMLNDQNNKLAVSEAHIQYFNEVQSKLHRYPPISQHQLFIFHDRAMTRAKQDFNSKRLTTQGRTADKYERKLVQEILELYTNFQQLNYRNLAEYEELQEMIRREEQRNRRPTPPPPPPPPKSGSSCNIL